MINGFKGLINKYNLQGQLDINMNSLAHHVPLYRLQRDFGHDPQKIIDSKAKNNINGLSKGSEILLGDRWDVYKRQILGEFSSFFSAPAMGLLVGIILHILVEREPAPEKGKKK